jgi:cephalosporin hydroxylase
MMNFYDEYLRMKTEPSDLNEHIETLNGLALECDNIVELGVGFGKSTRAFIYALETTLGTLNSYDILLHDGVQELFDEANKEGIAALFHLQSSLECDISNVDMLFIDSHHTYQQVKAELDRHSDKVKKYIVFHDTTLFGLSGQDPGSIGLWPAINAWLDSSPQWKVKQEYINNNGLLICERKS